MSICYCWYRWSIPRSCKYSRVSNQSISSNKCCGGGTSSNDHGCIYTWSKLHRGWEPPDLAARSGASRSGDSVQIGRHMLYWHVQCPSQSGTTPPDLAPRLGSRSFFLPDQAQIRWFTWSRCQIRCLQMGWQSPNQVTASRSGSSLQIRQQSQIRQHPNADVQLCQLAQCDIIIIIILTYINVK